MTNVSIADRIRQADDVGRESLDIPEWGVVIELRSMSARQRAQMQNHVSDEGSIADRQEALWTFLLTSCCFDPETGDPVFEESDMEWLLNDKSFAVIDRLAGKCLAVSAVNQDSLDEAGKDFSDSLTETE